MAKKKDTTDDGGFVVPEAISAHVEAALKNGGKSGKPTAADQLRAFEDEKLGPNVTRWEGRVERGHGSLHSRMTAEDKDRHAKLEMDAEAEGNGR